MKLSKERRVYAAILGLAGAAWVGDRVLFSGGPQPASAGAVPAEQAPAPAPIAKAAPVGVPLADRLERLRQSQPGSAEDAFAVPDEWRPKAAAAKAEAAAPPRFDAEAFKSAHRLTTVLKGTRGNFAVIDGGSLRTPGQELDGMILREVTSESAVFERDGVLVELRISRPGVTDGRVGGASENAGDGGADR
jgi:hypothetical protein